MRSLTLTLIFSATFLSIGCDTKKTSDFSILPDANFYAQDALYEPRKIDILWIIDNSGSMQTSQENLAANFKSFIQRFESLKFDYHIGVGATDGWKTLFDTTKPHANLRDGSGAKHSGIFVIDRDTPDIVNTFMTNVRLGINGTGDERAFQSLQATLSNPNNSAFRREDAFLAVIIVSDEDDFSHDTAVFANSHYNDPKFPLHPIQKYVDFLDAYTGRTSPSMPANYSVSVINVPVPDPNLPIEQSCKYQLNKDGFDRYPGVRYMELANATGGTIASLCAPFDETLTSISDAIVNYSSVFPLTRVPIVSSIVIHVDGVLIPQDAQNGWTYREGDNSIWFHGTSIPPAGAGIRIDFDPVGIKL